MPRRVRPGVNAIRPMDQRRAKRREVMACLKEAEGGSQSSSTTFVETSTTSHSSRGGFALIRSDPANEIAAYM